MQKGNIPTLNTKAAKLRKQYLNPFVLRLFLLFKLPMAFIAGLKITYLDPKTCKVPVPFKWLTQNPFKSTYFASLSMAAEMSTGALALLAIENCSDKISMLVVNMEGNFSKKASNITTFTCEDGLILFEAVEQASRTGESVSATVQSVGRDKNGVEIARFNFTWSFKKKSR